MKALYYSMLKFQPENLKLLRAHFDVVELNTPSEDTDEVLADIGVAFAPLGYLFDKGKIDRMPKLKCIASNTTGEPHIDRVYAESKGIAVCSLKFEQRFLATITPTAEHTWGLLLALTRRTPWAFQSVLDGTWDRRPWGGKAMLSRLSIGIVGFGRLGSLVGNYAKAFQMKHIQYFDPFVDVQVEGIEKATSLEMLAAQSDVISIHVPAEPDTHKMFGKAFFDACKDGAYLINTARGELVDEEALLEVLASGKLSGAALDVFDGEYAEDGQERWQKNPLLSYAKEHDNLLLTPHIGGSTLDAWGETEKRAIELILESIDTTSLSPQ